MINPYPICPSCNGIGFVRFGDTLPCLSCKGKGWIDVDDIIQTRLEKEVAEPRRLSSLTAIKAVRIKEKDRG